MIHTISYVHIVYDILFIRDISRNHVCIWDIVIYRLPHRHHMSTVDVRYRIHVYYSRMISNIRHTIYYVCHQALPCCFKCHRTPPNAWAYGLSLSYSVHFCFSLKISEPGEKDFFVFTNTEKWPWSRAKSMALTYSS